MDILNISKDEGVTIVRLSSSELVKLANVLYRSPDEEKNGLYYKLYGEIMIARELSQYGHIDDFSFKCISKCRESLNH